MLPEERLQKAKRQVREVQDDDLVRRRQAEALDNALALLDSVQTDVELLRSEVDDSEVVGRD
jgi:hypothetical protein